MRRCEKCGGRGLVGWEVVTGGAAALPYREDGDRLKERQRQRQLVREARRDGEDD